MFVSSTRNIQRDLKFPAVFHSLTLKQKVWILWQKVDAGTLSAELNAFNFKTSH